MREGPYILLRNSTKAYIAWVNLTISNIRASEVVGSILIGN
jgi:hypothetical protein